MLENLHKISLTSIEKSPVTQPNIYSLGTTVSTLLQIQGPIFQNEFFGWGSIQNWQQFDQFLT